MASWGFWYFSWDLRLSVPGGQRRTLLLFPQNEVTANEHQQEQNQEEQEPKPLVSLRALKRKKNEDINANTDREIREND